MLLGKCSFMQGLVVSLPGSSVRLCYTIIFFGSQCVYVYSTEFMYFDGSIFNVARNQKFLYFTYIFIFYYFHLEDLGIDRRIILEWILGK
jgi:hypothetical protein